jgi:hypothetical protein
MVAALRTKGRGLLSPASAAAAAELPVGLASLLVVKAGRRLLRARAVGRRGTEPPSRELGWVGWSELNMGRSTLIRTMIVSPRWNPHAIQHLLGPLAVQRSLAIDVAAASRSARIWIISVYRDGVAVHGLTNTSATSDGWHEISLSPGSYSLAVRYYGLRPGAGCPALVVDHQQCISEKSVEIERQGYRRFLESLRNRKGCGYRFLHSHAELAVRHRRWLGERFVRSVYLPYGNPDTAFVFGAIDAGEALRLELAADILAASSVHVVFINRSGFPMSWDDVPEPHYLSSPMRESGSYLIRVISPVRKLDADDLRVMTMRGEPSAHGHAL